MPTHKWEAHVDDEVLKDVESVNKNITDLTKFVTKAKEDAESVAKDKLEDIEEEDTSTPPTPPPTPGTPPPPPAPGPTPPGGPTPPAPAPAPTPPVGGGHSKKSNRVRGIENKLRGEVDFTTPTAWLRSGGIPATRKDVVSTSKWEAYQDVYKAMKKSITELNVEEIAEKERFNIIGEQINITDWANGKEKYFDRITVPDMDLAEINVIVALDASGSTGSRRQYEMSGVTLGAIKALEETKTRHSLLIYDDEVSVVQVNQVGRTANSNVLAGNMCGRGGNAEKEVLKVIDEITLSNQDAKNIVILISDGGVDNVEEQVKKMSLRHTNQINVYCLGFGEDFDTEYAKKIFGEDRAIGTKNNKDFASQFIKIISKELSKTRRGE